MIWYKWILPFGLNRPIPSFEDLTPNKERPKDPPKATLIRIMDLFLQDFLNSEGVFPVAFLKMLLKDDLLLNPTSNAIPYSE